MNNDITDTGREAIQETISDKRFNCFNQELIDRYFNDEGKLAIAAYAADRQAALLVRLLNQFTRYRTVRHE